jgi:hypothetical protein
MMSERICIPLADLGAILRNSESVPAATHANITLCRPNVVESSR